MTTASVWVEQIRDGTAARNIKEFAAQGLLPLTEDELIPLQILLSKDSDGRIASAAQGTLQKVSEQVWIRLVERKTPDPEIISFCLEQKSLPSIVKEKILLNHSIPDEIIRHMASTQAGHILDLIINNHVRLLRDPELLPTLERNASLSVDQKRRLEEFRMEFIIKKQRLEAHVEALPVVEKAPVEDILAQVPSLDEEAKRILKTADEVPQEEPSDEQVQQTLKNLLATEDLKQASPEIVSTWQRILKMKYGQRIRVALLGNKEERSILIRDSSKQVASMVLKNPRLTDPEVEGFAQMRNIDSDLLRQMGQSREFLKRYTVIHCLVKNPKTPSPIALNLLKLLREADLKNLEKDKNIPEVLRRQAKKLKDAKELKKN